MSAIEPWAKRGVPLFPGIAAAAITSSINHFSDLRDLGFRIYERLEKEGR
jgi:hypothetical protein